MLDGVLVINELVVYARRNKNQNFLFKFDFEKAFDFVSWEYLISFSRKLTLEIDGLNG